MKTLLALALLCQAAVVAEARLFTMYFTNGVLVSTNASIVPTNAPSPTFSPDGGLAPTNVVVTAAGMNICWTTNGASPSTNDQAWPSPATITNMVGGGAVVKALAWLPTHTTPSSVATSAPFTNAPAGGGYTRQDYVSDSGTTYVADGLNWYFYAYRWQASNSYTMRTNVIDAYYASGVPTKFYTNLIFADSAGSVGALLSGGTSTANAGSTCPSSEGKWAFGGLSAPIVSGDFYWTVVAMQQGGYEPSGNIIKILLKLDSGYASWKKSDNGTAWTDDVGNVRLRFETWGDQ